MPVQGPCSLRARRPRRVVIGDRLDQLLSNILEDMS